MISSRVFSEYDVEQIGIKVGKETTAVTNSCVGSAEETLDTKTVTKKCRGIVAKKKTKGTGTGTLKLSLHMEQDLFAALYSMENESLKDGVIAYGRESNHPDVCITEKVLDEDGKVKYKAYPKCSVQSGISRKVQSNGEEVTESEIEFALMPDDYGNCMYEALETDLSDADLKSKWMSQFTPAMTRIVNA